MTDGALTLRRRLLRLVAMLLLTTCYGFALAVATVFPRNWRRGKKRNGNILAIGTFHNPNWFLAHIAPLSQCGCRRLILIADGHTEALPNVKVVVPHPFVARIIGRALAKSLWAFAYGIRYRFDLIMGYAIFPAAATALTIGRLFGRPSCFQLTSGQLELEGGGYAAENRVLGALREPSEWIEKLAHAVTRKFDLIVVRGAQAESYVRELGYRGAVQTITGSVPKSGDRVSYDNRETDLIFVGRLTERKRPLQFVEVVGLLKGKYPELRALLVGDGPDYDIIENKIRQLGLQDNIELTGLRKDVDVLLNRTKVFVLTSRWEGLSIAMLEAMTAGTVPIVNDVGDLRDVVDDGENGYLIKSGDPDEFAERISDVLATPANWDAFSERARSRASSYSGREAIIRKWNAALSEFVDVKPVVVEE